MCGCFVNNSITRCLVLSFSATLNRMDTMECRKYDEYRVDFMNSICTSVSYWYEFRYCLLYTHSCDGNTYLLRYVLSVAKIIPQVTENSEECTTGVKAASEPMETVT